jgi:hypothetical protein
MNTGISYFMCKITFRILLELVAMQQLFQKRLNIYVMKMYL